MTLRTTRPSHQSTSLRPFNVNTPIKSHDAPSADLKSLKWPEEELTFTIDDHGGFYPAWLGRTFDGGWFVITGKLGWG